MVELFNPSLTRKTLAKGTNRQIYQFLLIERSWITEFVFDKCAPRIDLLPVYKVAK